MRGTVIGLREREEGRMKDREGRGRERNREKGVKKEREWGGKRGGEGQALSHP